MMEVRLFTFERLLKYYYSYIAYGFVFKVEIL